MSSGNYYAKFKQDWTVRELGARFEREARAAREQRSLEEWIG